MIILIININTNEIVSEQKFKRLSDAVRFMNLVNTGKARGITKTFKAAIK